MISPQDVLINNISVEKTRINHTQQNPKSVHKNKRKSTYRKNIALWLGAAVAAAGVVIRAADAIHAPRSAGVRRACLSAETSRMT